MNQGNFIKIEECFRQVRITGELSDSSISKYRDSIKKFFMVIGDKSFESLAVIDFEDFILKMRDNGASNSRIANVISAVKCVIKRLQAGNIISKNLDLDKIIKPKMEKKEVAYLTESEIGMLLNAISGDVAFGAVRKARFFALISFLLQTGARIGEVLSINHDNINRQTMEVAIMGKGSKPRTLLLREETLQALDKYLELRKDNNPALFVALNGKSRWMQTDIGRSFRRYKNLSEIKKHFTIHTLRHTFATQMLFANVPINVVQFMLGHSSLETTMKYYIGNIEKAKAREYIQDKYYNFIPKMALEKHKQTNM
jgi:integrase/recombinase XerD